MRPTKKIKVNVSNVQTPERNEEEILAKQKVIRLIGARDVASRRIEFAMGAHRNTRGQKLDFTNREYQLQIYADPSLDITMRVPVQIGKTEWQVCDSLAAASLGLGVFCVQPKFELRGVHVAERYDKLIQASKEYQKFQGAKSRDSTTLKHFGKGSLRFVGSRVETDMISFPADLVQIDELDRCDLSMITLADDRYEESDYKLIRRTSTPTYAGSSKNRNIDYYYNISDQKHWYVPCPECGKVQEIGWDTHLLNINKDREGRITNATLIDPDWTEGKWQRTGQRIKLACNECKASLNRLSSGQWIKHNPEVKNRSGYSLSRFFAVTTEIERIWLAFEKALGNPTALQRVFNSFLGLPYAGIGDRLTEETLDEATLVAPQYMAPQGACSPCSMGIDVNRPWFDYWISDYPLLDHNKTISRCIAVGKVKTEQELHDLVKQYGVSVAVIDSEPEVRLSLRFQEDATCEVWRVRYEHTEGLLVKDMIVDHKSGLVRVDRTSSLDYLLQQYLRKLVALPYNYEELCFGDFKKELLGAVRLLLVEHGVERYVWAGEGAHALHTCNYDLLAKRIGGFMPSGHFAVLNEAKGMGMSQSETGRMIDEFDKCGNESGIFSSEYGRRSSF